MGSLDMFDGQRVNKFSNADEFLLSLKDFREDEDAKIRCVRSKVGEDLVFRIEYMGDTTIWSVPIDLEKAGIS